MVWVERSGSGWGFDGSTSSSYSDIECYLTLTLSLAGDMRLRTSRQTVVEWKFIAHKASAHQIYRVVSGQRMGKLLTCSWPRQQPGHQAYQQRPTAISSLSSATSYARGLCSRYATAQPGHAPASQLCPDGGRGRHIDMITPAGLFVRQGAEGSQENTYAVVSPGCAALCRPCLVVYGSGRGTASGCHLLPSRKRHQILVLALAPLRPQG